MDHGRLSRRATGAVWLATAVIGGVSWGLCFHAQARPWLACLALAPLLMLAGVAPETTTRGRNRWNRSMPWRIGLGWLYGVASWLVAIPWIASTVSTFGDASPALGLLALLLLSLYLGLFPAAFSALGPLVTKRGPAAVLSLPALWVSLEWLRAYLLTGFPWNLAAYSWIDLPGALPASAWIGAYGVSFLVVLTNVAVVRAILLRSVKPLAGLLPVVLLLLLGWWQQSAAISAGSRATAARESGSGVLDPGASDGAGVVVRLVQPNTNIFLDPSNDRIRDGLERLFRLSECTPDELLLWPESAAWPYSFDRDAAFRNRVESMTNGGCGVLLNSAREDSGKFYNSALLVDNRAVLARYDKNQLVPFGEYVPLGSWLPFVRQIARIESGFTASHELELLPWGGELLGVAICFEIIFADQVAARVRKGASILVTLTNDAWYGDTSAPWQHLAAARFRAAENGRPVLRAAITGISAIIDRFGTVQQQIGIDKQGSLQSQVAGRVVLTAYSRWPWLVPGACVVAVAALLLARDRFRRPRGSVSSRR